MKITKALAGLLEILEGKMELDLDHQNVRFEVEHESQKRVPYCECPTKNCTSELKI